MMNPRKMIWIVAFGATAMTALTADAQDIARSSKISEPPKSSKGVVPTEYGRINALKKTKKITDFANLAQEVEQTWKGKNPETYVNITFAIFQNVVSLDFGSSQQGAREQLARKLAVSALQYPDAMLVETETSFLVPLAFLDSLLNPEARDTQTELMLHAWNRVTKEKDPSFKEDDPKNKFFLNLAPPTQKGQIMPLSQIPISGVSPDSIKNPAQRKAYEEALTANGKQAMYSTQQQSVRRAERQLVPAIQQYFSHFYTDVDKVTLIALLDKFEIAKEDKDHIIQFLPKGSGVIIEPQIPQG